MSRGHPTYIYTTGRVVPSPTPRMVLALACTSYPIVPYSLCSPSLSNPNAKQLKYCKRCPGSEYKTHYWCRVDANNNDLSPHGERWSDSHNTRHVTHSPCRGHTGNTASSPPSPLQAQTAECRPAKQGQGSRKLATERRAIDCFLRGQRRLHALRSGIRNFACIGS